MRRAVLFLFFLCLTAPAWAETATNGGSMPGEGVARSGAQQVAPAPAAPEHLLGDWGGLQPWLNVRGITLDFEYTGETSGVVAGGKSRGFDYADQFALENDIDWGKLADLSGFSTHTAFVRRDGVSTSASHLDDRLLQSQEIFGGGGDVAVHLVYLYAEQKLLDQRLALAGGRLPFGNDFANSPLDCNFMQVAICGNPHAIVATPGVTVWPISTWAARVRYNTTANTYVQTGAYEVNSQNGGRSGFNWSTNNATGGVFPVEIGYKPLLGADKLPGHYKIGGLYNTSPLSSFSDMGGENDHRAVRGWVLADQMLKRNGPTDTDGIIALAGYTRGNGNVDIFQDFAYAGLLDKDFLAQRPDDTAGLLVAYAHVSSNLSNQQFFQSQSNLPFSEEASGVQNHELVVEVNYNVHAFRGFDIMPDAQFIDHPGATSRYPDALLVGLKTHVQF